MGKLITIPITVDADELWSDVFGSGWEYSEWFTYVEYVGCSWDTAGTAKVTHWSSDDEGVTEVTSVTIDDIVRGYSILASDNWLHCNGDALNNPDACTSDAILQMAIYGELVYG